MSRAQSTAEDLSGPDYLRACDRLLWRLDHARAELRDILNRTESRIVQVPRRHIEQLLSWLDTLDDEEDNICTIKSLIGRRIEALIACLDALEPDGDLEEEDLDNDDLREAEEVAG